MKTRLALALAGLLWAVGALANTVQFDVTVPGSGTPFDFDSDGTNNWPLVRLWDGATKMVINPNGQATVNNSQPVVLPAAQVTPDPCTMQPKITAAFSSTAGEFQIVAPAAVTQVYICAISYIPTAATSISIVGGLAPNCTTGSPLAIKGSITAANGPDIPAGQDGGQGVGAATVLSTTTSGHGVCILQSGTTKIAGAVTYVQQ